jgi:hypothetical protein
VRDHLVEPEKEVARAVTELDDPFDVIDNKCLWLVERIARARHMGVRVIPLRDFLLQEFFTVVSAARTSEWNSAGFSAGRRESGEVPRLRENASESCAGTTEAGTITCPHRTAPHRTAPHRIAPHRLRVQRDHFHEVARRQFDDIAHTDVPRRGVDGPHPVTENEKFLDRLILESPRAAL